MGKPEVKQRAVFLDRDGVINKPIIQHGKPYPPAQVNDFEIYADVAPGIERLREAGYLLIVVTNQPDVARGKQKREVVEAIHEKMLTILPQIASIEVCWHGGAEWADPCECRKPQPGMLLRAARALNIDLSQSFVIGDRWQDIDCGQAAGCRTVLIDRDYSESLQQIPNWSVSSFTEAVEAILLSTVRS
jgi:D-glycero-D-manno-heptose 1,7-bisphosphate phosphatase